MGGPSHESGAEQAGRISRDRLAELLEYNPETGIFTRRFAYRGNAVPGLYKPWKTNGYSMIGLDMRKYYLHHLAWLYVYGEWPSLQIDHINGNKSDNRILNLRLATQTQNNCNRGATRTNRCGLKGVQVWNGRFHARIGLNYKTRYIGSFDCPAAAHFAYIIEADKLHGEFARANGVA